MFGHASSFEALFLRLVGSKVRSSFASVVECRTLGPYGDVRSWPSAVYSHPLSCATRWS